MCVETLGKEEPLIVMFTRMMLIYGLQHLLYKTWMTS